MCEPGEVMADRVVKVWDQLRNRAVFNAWSEVLDMKRQEAAEAAAMAEREVRAKKIFARALKANERTFFYIWLGAVELAHQQRDAALEKRKQEALAARVVAMWSGGVARSVFRASLPDRATAANH